MASEIAELAAKAKKESIAKKSSSSETSDDNEKRNNSSDEYRKKTEDGKRKASKRKKTVNESAPSKLLKLSETSKKTEDELQQSYLEKEALMATQSILGDDDSKGLFEYGRHTDNDMLDMERFRKSPDDISSIENPVGLDIDDATNLINPYANISADIPSQVSPAKLNIPPKKTFNTNQPQAQKSSSLNDLSNSEYITSLIQEKRKQALGHAGGKKLSMSSMYVDSVTQQPKSLSLRAKLMQQQIALRQQQDDEIEMKRRQQLQQLQQVKQQQQQQQKVSQPMHVPVPISVSSSLNQGYSEQQLKFQQQYRQKQQQQQQQLLLQHSLSKNNNKQINNTQMKRNDISTPVIQAKKNSKNVQPQLNLNIGNYGNQATSLQTLSQFITSKVIPNVITSSSSSVQLKSPGTPAVSNGTGKNTITLVQQNPYQIQVSRSQGTAQVQLNQAKKIAAEVVSPSSIGNPQFQVVDIKGSRGNQIIVSRPPSTIPNAKRISSQAVQSFSLNQLMAVARARNSEQTTTPQQSIRSPTYLPATQIIHSSSNPQLTSLRSPVASPVTSIQAMMQLSAKPEQKQVNNKQFSIQQQLLSKHQLLSQQQLSSQHQLPGDKLQQNVAKVVRIPKSLIPGRPGSPLTDNSKTLSFPSRLMQHHQTLQGGLVNPRMQMGSINSPVVAPLKISLPRTKFPPGVASPVRSPSPGQSPIRLTAPGIRLTTSINPNIFTPSTNRYGQQK